MKLPKDVLSALKVLEDSPTDTEADGSLSPADLRAKSRIFAKLRAVGAMMGADQHETCRLSHAGEMLMAIVGDIRNTNGAPAGKSDEWLAGFNFVLARLDEAGRLTAEELADRLMEHAKRERDAGMPKPAFDLTLAGHGSNGNGHNGRGH